MATVGVVNVTDKLHVLSNATNVDSSKRQLFILRKPAKLAPEPTDSNILLTNTSRRKTRVGKEMTKIPHPPPIAVARRNARERNRVKQVNNGFATLRQHIPTAIAAAYESGSGRGSNKKLSKVETLRMAVEYIKSLEKLLALSSDENSGAQNDNSPSSQSYTTIASMSPTSSHLTYSYVSHLDDDELGNSRSKILKNEYLMDTHLYEDEENLYPSNMDGMEEDILNETSLVDTKLELSDSHDISLLHSMDNTASLSPEVYSEHSLSPASLEPNGSKSYIPVFEVSGGGSGGALPPFAHLSYERLPPIKSELLSPSGAQACTDDASSDPQTLVVNERVTILDQHSTMIDVMTWWQQQNRS